MQEIVAWLPTILACGLALVLSGVVKGILSIVITIAAIGLLIWGGMKLLGSDTKRID